MILVRSDGKVGSDRRVVRLLLWNPGVRVCNNLWPFNPKCSRARYEIYDRYNSNAKKPDQLLCVKRADYQENGEFLISLEKYVQESDRLRRVHQQAPIPTAQWEE